MRVTIRNRGRYASHRIDGIKGFFAAAVGKRDSKLILNRAFIYDEIQTFAVFNYVTRYVLASDCRRRFYSVSIAADGGEFYVRYGFFVIRIFLSVAFVTREGNVVTGVSIISFVFKLYDIRESTEVYRRETVSVFVFVFLVEFVNGNFTVCVGRVVERVNSVFDYEPVFRED